MKDLIRATRNTAKSLVITNWQIRLEMVDVLKQRLRELRAGIIFYGFKINKRVLWREIEAFLILEYAVRNNFVGQKK